MLKKKVNPQMVLGNWRAQMSDTTDIKIIQDAMRMRDFSMSIVIICKPK
jgi:hypothetical protein